MELVNTITGVAEGILNDAGQWRKVVQNNPSELFGKLPPSLQVDIDKYYNTAKLIGDKLNIKGLEDKDAASVMGTLFKGKLGGVVSNATFNRAAVELENLKGNKDVKNTLDILKQIDWLL